MARVGVKYLLNYYKHILDYKRSPDMLMYKNWTIAGCGVYLIKFVDVKIKWVVLFKSPSSIMHFTHNDNDKYTIDDVTRHLKSMDIIALHAMMCGFVI